MLLLDGGNGHLIKQWGVQIPGLAYDQQFLAGLLANEADPATVLRAHAAYISAGCRCITTNNFVATAHSLAKVQRSADACRLSQLAGQLARQAVQDGGQPSVLVAGSLPPLLESYQTCDLPAAAAMVQEYAAIAAALLPWVDVFLAETLSTSGEAAAAVQATSNLGKPLWVSFTLEDSTACCLRSKEPLSTAVAGLLQPRPPHLAAILLNCCSPAAVTAALPGLKQQCVPAGVRVGCFANGFRTTTTQWLTGADEAAVPTDPGDYDGEGIITPEAYARHARAWQAAGADMIGGCCGVGPQHMKLLAQQLHCLPG